MRTISGLLPLQSSCSAQTLRSTQDPHNTQTSRRITLSSLPCKRFWQQDGLTGGLRNIGIHPFLRVSCSAAPPSPSIPASMPTASHTANAPTITVAAQQASSTLVPAAESSSLTSSTTTLSNPPSSTPRMPTLSPPNGIQHPQGANASTSYTHITTAADAADPQGNAPLSLSSAPYDQIISSDFLSPGPLPAGRRVYLVILNYCLPEGLFHVWSKASFRICADGGTNRLHDELIAMMPPPPLDIAATLAAALTDVTGSSPATVNNINNKDINNITEACAAGLSNHQDHQQQTQLLPHLSKQRHQGESLLADRAQHVAGGAAVGSATRIATESRMPPTGPPTPVHPYHSTPHPEAQQHHLPSRRYQLHVDGATTWQLREEGRDVCEVGSSSGKGGESGGMGMDTGGNHVSVAPTTPTASTTTTTATTAGTTQSHHPPIDIDLPTALRLAHLPDVVLGDLDSLRPDVRQFYVRHGVPFLDLSYDQDTNDLAKAVSLVEQRFIRADPDSDPRRHQILVLGALGGRLDHTLANINVLHMFPHLDIALWGDGNLVRLLRPGRAIITPDERFEGPTCGLIPVAGPVTATSSGLRWDVNGTTLRVGGLVSSSNMLTGSRVEVTSDGPLLWTVELRQEPRPQMDELWERTAAAAAAVVEREAGVEAGKPRKAD